MADIAITPRLEIDLAKIRHNAAQLTERIGPLGVNVTGVTKAALGAPEVAAAMLSGGVQSIGDSRIENIRRMREAGIDAEFMLLRSPQLSRIDEVVAWADISLNSELAVIRRLSEAAVRQQRRHRVLLMVELGDLREGIPLADIDQVIDHCLGLPNIEIAGIGTNLTCLSGVRPDADNMGLLSQTAESLRQRYRLPLATVSAGNSATLDWLFNTEHHGAINHLRLGEAILLGCETLNRAPLAGLDQGAVTLVAEVIESKRKPSFPQGQIGQNAFGQVPVFNERGEIHRSILGIGHQDILIPGIVPENPDYEILGASSDHLVLDSTHCPLAVGEQVRFRLDYGALLAAMTSPFVKTVFL